MNHRLLLRAVRAFALLLAVLLLGGCGQKGPLRLPDSGPPDAARER